MQPGGPGAGRELAAPRLQKLRVLSQKNHSSRQNGSHRDGDPQARTSGAIVGGGGGGSGSAQETLAHAARLEGANAQLRERLAETLEELNVAHGQLRILQGLQQQLEEATPGAADLVAAAVEQERTLQAARDAQVLQLLRAKDDVIHSFEARHAESRAELAQLREALGAAQAAADNSQLRVSELVQSKQELRRQLDSGQAAKADAEAALRGEGARLQEEAQACGPLRKQVQQLEQQLGDARADLGSAHQRMRVLADTVDAANTAITEVQALLSEREEAVAHKEAEAQGLQRHLAQLLGLPHADARLVHAAQYGGGAARSDVEARMCALEAANERLEEALVEATRSAAGTLSAQPSAADSDADAVGELSAGLAVATGKLQAAEERVVQLEKLLKVAEATVLHNEVQLQETVEGRMAAEEQVHALRLELEDGQALLHQLKAKLEELAAAEQAAQSEAAAVHGALAAAMQQAAGVVSTVVGQRGAAAGQAAEQERQAAGVQGQPGAGLVREVQATVSMLLHRIEDLQQQLADEREAAAAAAAAAARRAERQAVGVQCKQSVHASAGVQATPSEVAAAVASGTQTEDVEAPARVGGSAGAGYGRPDAAQQQVAELTAQLAAARLEAVGAKAEHSCLEARLLDAERRLEEHAQAHAAATAHGPGCECPAAAQLRTKVQELQGQAGELGRRASAAQQEIEARVAQAGADAQAAQQALQAQLASLQGSAAELRELRSSAYATVARLQQACKEQGGLEGSAPDGCEPGSLPQQLRRAADKLLAMLQEHSELVTAFQQHLHQDGAAASSAAGPAGGSAEAAQRVVIRSLAVQLAALQAQAGAEQQRAHPIAQLVHAALGPGGGSVHPGAEEYASGLPGGWPAQLPLPGMVGGPASDAQALVGMVSLLKQQLAALDRIQHQLEPAQRGGSSPGPLPGNCGVPSAAHAAALLGTELPSLHATAAVLDGEVRRLVVQATADGQRSSSGGGVLCLPAAGAAAGSSHPAATAGALDDATRRGDKWKGRCKELKAQLASAERASADQVGTVRSLQQRVEDLAAAGAQLEEVLRDTAQQLAQAVHSTDELRAQAAQQRQHQAQAEVRFKEQLEESAGQLVAAQASLEEQRQENSALAARMEALGASVQSSDGAEEGLRCQLRELGEQVAVLTAAHEAARAEVLEQRQALTAAQQELGGTHAAHAQLAAEKQRREEELAGRLSALQQECRTLLAVVERAEEQQAEVEERFHAQLAGLDSQLATLGADAAAHEPALASALGWLQQHAEAWEVRLLRLEAQAAVAAEDRQEGAAARWATLERCRRYRAAVRQLRDGLQAQLLDAQAVAHQQAAQLESLQAALNFTKEERDQLAAQLQAAQQQHEYELQQAAADARDALAAQQHEAEHERLCLQQQAQEAAAAAVAAAEERCRVEAAARACQLQQRALADLETAEQQCGGLQAQLDALRAEFKRYQAIKAVEVRLLEQRVLRQLRPGGTATGGSRAAGAGADATPSAGAASPPASLDDLEAACCNEGIAAALREARLERLQREQLQADLAAAHALEDQLAQLRGRARATEQELAAAKGRHAGERERAERLAAELADCQAALRLAKSEGGRRLKDLQALQRQAAAGENSGPNAAAQLEGEREARKAAETQLREARQALARKAELVKDLRAKVSSLERELAKQDPAPLIAELEACQARLRQAQAACGSKEAAVRELRERLEQQARLAHEQGALEERHAQAAERQRMGQELASRDVQLSGLHRQLQQVHRELANASTGLQEAAAGHSAEAGEAAAQLAEARECVLQLVHTLRLLLATLAQLGAAAAAAAEQQTGQVDVDELAAAAGDLARLVDLSADDIGAVLLPSAGQAGGGGGAAALEGAARQAWAAIEQLEARAANEQWRQTQECAAPLQAAVAALQEQSKQLGAALAAAPGGGGEFAQVVTGAYF